MGTPPQDERSVLPEEFDRGDISEGLLLGGRIGEVRRLEVDRLAVFANPGVDEVNAAAQRDARPVCDLEIEGAVAKFDIVEIGKGALDQQVDRAVVQALPDDGLFLQKLEFIGRHHWIGHRDLNVRALHTLNDSIVFLLLHHRSRSLKPPNPR